MELFGDPLRRQAQELENKLSITRVYDREAWQVLIAVFEAHGRIAGAASLRARVAHIESLLPEAVFA